MSQDSESLEAWKYAQKDNRKHKRLLELLELRKWTDDTKSEAKGILMMKFIKGGRSRTDHFLVKDDVLHLAMSTGAPVEIVEAIILQAPKAPKSLSHFGKQTPLHCAMAGGAPTNTTKLVLEAYPAAAKIKDSNGRLPLHLGMYHRAPVEIIQCVLAAYPKAAQIQADCDGQTPLHCGTALWPAHMRAYYDTFNKDSIQLVAESYPSAVAIKDKYGKTPLQKLLELGASADIVMSVVKALPSALDATDSTGRTTLRAAMEGTACAAVLTEIIINYPAQARMTLEDGQTSLHVIMQHKESALAVWALLNAYEGCPTESYLGPDSKGQTPLHKAMLHDAPTAAIEVLLNAHPAAASQKDVQGRTPLATGIESGASLASIKTLLQAFPETATATDQHGNTPLHVCILKSDDPASGRMDALVENGLNAISVRNKEGYPPLHLALHLVLAENLKKQHAVLRHLIRACPDAAKATDKKGNSALLFLMIHTYVGRMDALSRPGEASRSMNKKAELGELVCKAYPLAAEIENYEGLSPISLVVNYCSISAKYCVIRFDEFRHFGLLQALLAGLRDGRPLKKLCKLDDPDALNMFLLLFTDPRRLQDNHAASIDLNNEAIFGWTFLEILADLDTAASSNILLQIVETQHNNLTTPGGMIKINCVGKRCLLFRSIEEVRENTMRRVADRAKLSISSDKLRKWGQVHGRFLKRYQIDKNKRPKHVSETCVVVFGTETRVSENERQHDVQVALKFLSDCDAFCRELDKRYLIRQCEKTGDSESTSLSYVVSVLACYTSRREEEVLSLVSGEYAGQIVCDANFDDLKSYEHIHLTSKDKCRELEYLLVMECGAGLDLNDVISHQNIAGRDLPLVLSISARIAECLQFLNEECHINHGDVKARNFISLGVGAGYAAIDLDNAASILTGERVGLKRTSSGYLPPEQAAMESFWRASEGMNTDLAIPTLQGELEDLEKAIEAARQSDNYDEQLLLLQARKLAQSKLKQLHRSSTSPTPVTATPQYDMWCFGALLYYLCSGTQLFNMDFREDVNDSDLSIIQQWDNEKMFTKLQSIPEGWPRGLIADLLQPDPANRPRAWNDVIRKLRNIPTITGSRTAAVDDPCMWSITYWQLMEIDKKALNDFGQTYADFTMRDIAEKVIQPRCQTSGTSFALSLNPNGLMLDAFISHSWDEPFQEFVSSIRKVFQTSVTKPALWICAFALNQCDHQAVVAQVGTEAIPLSSSPFVKALEHALTFVVVRNPITDLYTRIWCVCELIYAKKLGLIPHKAYVTGPDIFSQMRTSCLDAQSTEPEDKTRILQVLLKEHDVGEIDQIVQLFRTQEAPE